MAQLVERGGAWDGLPGVREVEISRPLVWLRKGADDLAVLKGHSLAYGLAVAVAGALLITLGWGATYLVPALIGGFLLVAPFVAIGLYALSRQRAAGAPIDPAAALFAWRSNRGSIALFGLLLALALILWERLSAIVFALSYGGAVPDLRNLMADIFLSGQHLPLALAFIGTGAVLAAVVYLLSVVSAPMLLDRPVDVATAVLTSVRCCSRNPGAMLLWAVLIAGLSVIGFATLMLGLIVLFPLLAHASWHAYRDLVEP
jgi:uncharacterized membrane protein